MAISKKHQLLPVPSISLVIDDSALLSLDESSSLDGSSSNNAAILSEQIRFSLEVPTYIALSTLF